MDITTRIIQELLKADISDIKKYDIRVTHSTKGVKVNISYVFNCKSMKKAKPTLKEALEEGLTNYKNKVDYYIESTNESNYYQIQKEKALKLKPYIENCFEILWLEY